MMAPNIEEHKYLIFILGELVLQYQLDCQIRKNLCLIVILKIRT